MCFPFFSEIIFYFKQLTNDIENKYYCNIKFKLCLFLGLDMSNNIFLQISRGITFLLPPCFSDFFYISSTCSSVNLSLHISLNIFNSSL